MASLSRTQTEEWLRQMEIKSDRVVDIGGSANPVNRRIKNWNVKDYIIIDNCAEQKEFEKKDSGKRWFPPDIVYDINYSFTKEIKDRCKDTDIVFMMGLLPHLWDVITAIKNANDILKSGGLLYVNAPYLIPIHKDEINDFTRLTPKGIEKILEKTGFTDIKIKLGLYDGKSEKILRDMYLRDRMRGNYNINQSVIQSLVRCKKI